MTDVTLTAGINSQQPSEAAPTKPGILFGSLIHTTSLMSCSYTIVIVQGASHREERDNKEPHRTPEHTDND
jgi:hypothetical protein